MDLLRRNPMLAALAIAAVVLAVIVAIEAASGVRPAVSPPSVRPASPAEAKLLPPLVVANIDQAYPETTARPLWVPTRRPAPKAAATPAESFKRDQFVLQGVTIAGDTKIAMLRDKASGRFVRAEKGKEVSGIQVLDVQPESVTLGMGEEREVLELRVQKAAATTPPNARAVAQGPFAPPSNVPAPGGAAVPVPVPPGGAPPGAPAPARPANAPVPGSAPAQAGRPAAAPMTAEELLARRRARRTGQPTK
jgi:hypothetical protein